MDMIENSIAEITELIAKGLPKSTAQAKAAKRALWAFIMSSEAIAKLVVRNNHC